MKGYLIMTGFDNSMRSLAANKILNFDANAFVMGTNPMYVGSPEPDLQLPFDAPIVSPNFRGYAYGVGSLRAQPSVDAFVSHGTHEKSSFSTKTGILGLIAGGLGLAGITAYLTRSKKDLEYIDDFDKVPTKTSEVISKVKEFSSSSWSKLKGMHWGFKAAIAGVAGLTVLYGLYKAVTGSKVEHPQLPEGNLH